MKEVIRVGLNFNIVENQVFVRLSKFWLYDCD